MELLANYVERNRFLEMLDISWNELQAKAYKPLLLALGTNRNLRCINLSSNLLLDAKEQSLPGVYALPGKL